MSHKLRLSPSGPIVAEIGDGFPLRTKELMSNIVGTLQIPATLAAGIVCTDGFGGSGVLAVEMLDPEPLRKYSAEFWIDINNTTTNIDAVVVVELERSVDGGATWLGFARNQHQINAEDADLEQARMVRINLVPTLGADLGVLQASPSLAWRVRMGTPTVNAVCNIYSPGTDGYGNPGLKGCFFLKMTEHLAE